MTGVYYCKEHGAVWFKKGNMRGHAHPIEGTDPTEWCNMPEGTEPTELPPPTRPIVSEREQKVVEEAHETAPPSPPKEPAPQAVGMITKEIGDMIRSKYLKPIFGDEVSVELMKWYQAQVLGITRVTFSSKQLPTFKSVEHKEE